MHQLQQYNQVMKNLEKNRFTLKKMASLNHQQQGLNSKKFLNKGNLQHSSKLQKSEKNLPCSEPTIGQYSTLAGVSRGFDQLDEFMEESRIFQGGSCGFTPIEKKKNGRLAESFDKFSDTESNSSQVLFVSSRDMTEKKLREINLAKSFKFQNNMATSSKNKHQVNDDFKNVSINPEQYEKLLKKNEQLEMKNKQLNQQNQKLLKKISALQEQKIMKNKNYRIPSFIRNRQMQKNVKSTINCGLATTTLKNKRNTPQNQIKINEEKWKIITQSWEINEEPESRPQRHTLGNCKSFEELMGQIKKQCNKNDIIKVKH